VLGEFKRIWKGEGVLGEGGGGRGYVGVVREGCSVVINIVLPTVCILGCKQCTEDWVPDPVASNSNSETLPLCSLVLVLPSSFTVSRNRPPPRDNATPSWICKQLQPNMPGTEPFCSPHSCIGREKGYHGLETKLCTPSDSSLRRERTQRGR